MNTNDTDRNVIGVIFCQVQVKNEKSSHILCPLEDLEFDMNTKFQDIFSKLHQDKDFLSKYDVIATIYPNSQLKDSEASPVRSLEKFVHFYHSPSSRYVKFTATLLSEVHEPPQKRRCINDVLTSNLHSQFKSNSALNNLLNPTRFDENKELNAKHKTYNRLIDHFNEKCLGWMENEHESNFKRREKGCDKRQGYGAQFVDKLSSLLCLISQHRDSLQKKIKYAGWLNAFMVVKSSRKRNLSSIDIKHAVLQLRNTLRGEWIKYKCWELYLKDIFNLMDMLEKHCDYRDKELEIQRVNQSSEVPARGPDDCRLLITSYVGKAGFIKDPRHKKISKILQDYPAFKP